jgi:hypothetical protein
MMTGKSESLIIDEFTFDENQNQVLHVILELEDHRYSFEDSSTKFIHLYRSSLFLSARDSPLGGFNQNLIMSFSRHIPSGL